MLVMISTYNRRDSKRKINRIYLLKCKKRGNKYQLINSVSSYYCAKFVHHLLAG